jgi:hypothetical protein
VDGFTALQNMGNNKFCKRLTAYGEDTGSFTRQYKEDCLSAATDVRAAHEAKLQVEEPKTPYGARPTCSSLSRP